MATFCKPFTSAKVRFFKHDQIARARSWLENDVSGRSAAMETK
jgi:hypothetical protein